ncbi:MAG: hypothetical protein JWO06_947 [Bacteroidota bacterium]|nr:hypothetical protein [Bacteroidota bacterium]
MQVITNDKGRVIGTARLVEQEAKAGEPKYGHIVAGDNQSFRELEVPKEIHEIKDTVEMHKALEKHLKLAK